MVSQVGSTTSVAVFFGDFTGSGGSTGGGDIFFEGDLQPGNSPALVTFENDVYFGVGAGLEIELGGAVAGMEHDQVDVVGDLTIHGELVVSLINGFTPSIGQSFTILTAADVNGTFATEMLPTVPGRLFDVIYNSTSVVLAVVPAFTADFDEDGDVDSADLAQWQGDFGENALSDADDDGDSDGNDFLAWQRQLGSGSPMTVASAPVPEPATVTLLTLAAVSLRALQIGRYRKF